jgi:hypothetical protein
MIKQLKRLWITDEDKAIAVLEMIILVIIIITLGSRAYSQLETWIGELAQSLPTFQLLMVLHGH